MYTWKLAGDPDSGCTFTPHLVGSRRNASRARFWHRLRDREGDRTRGVAGERRGWRVAQEVRGERERWGKQPHRSAWSMNSLPP